MLDKFITDIDINKLSEEQLKNLISEQPVKNKDIILSYLKKFPYSAFTSQPVFDKFSGEEVFFADNAHTDGMYTWYESEIYHFDKYNLKLNNDFIEHVLNKI